LDTLLGERVSVNGNKPRRKPVPKKTNLGRPRKEMLSDIIDEEGYEKIIRHTEIDYTMCLETGFLRHSVSTTFVHELVLDLL